MSRVCEITGKKPLSGNNVPHSLHKTRKRFLPNLNNVSFLSDILGTKLSLRLSRQGIRTIEHNGGIDNYLLTTQNSKLTEESLKLKKRILSAKEKKK